MDHVAIMKKSWSLIPRIVAGQKTIESRWYQTRRTPWHKAQIGETVYFKNSGEPVTACARISKVLYAELHTIDDIKQITNRFGKQIGLVQSDPTKWGFVPKYCILLFLESPRVLPHPFNINKTGFGSAAAWLSVENIESIQV